jgi:xanthine dehydrogenase accessory factor
VAAVEFDAAEAFQGFGYGELVAVLDGRCPGLFQVRRCFVEPAGVAVGEAGVAEEPVALVGGAEPAHDVGGADELAVLGGGAARLVRLTIADFEAQLHGLPRGGEALCLVVPATALPAQLWDHLRRRDPVCLVARMEGDRVVEVSLGDPAGATTSGSTLAADVITTVFAPVPALVVVGGGPVADAVAANARLLGWRVHVLADAGGAAGVIAGLSGLDSVVVAAHDLELAGSALQAALGSEAGYIGAIGSRRMQESRADWLAYRDVTDLSRLHGPAGLDIGARTPAEIAVAILAEAISTRARK